MKSRLIFASIAGILLTSVYAKHPFEGHPLSTKVLTDAKRRSVTVRLERVESNEPTLRNI